MTLMNAPKHVDLIIKDIQITDDELMGFLFSLGCYAGEIITIMNRHHNGCIVVVKDGKYTIDRQLANAIIV